ncbi:Bifunctional fucokinase/fucose pyrophosphorylase [Sesamum alatum]|uniref:Bifunctional fucokinase/fucose pyrophosphorylase n=1 Tax=Sesamum alatum TaxID=300844 RepID=A0AAE1XVU5_9LAMI|nr:Bifunctional fucokinase/fucose pyrophosphorylase [Sesamum alatum]
MGHANGIDCFIVKTLKNNDEKIQFHTLFSVPFKLEGHEQRLSRICSIPLPSNRNGNFVSSKFLLVALWMDGFQALSWEMTIHCYDSRGSCCDEHLQTFESEFSGNKYSVSVDPCSSVFPVPHNDDVVTCSAVVCPSDLVLSVEQQLSTAEEMGSCSYAYHMITGCANGSLKLWRSMPAQSMSSDTYWSLVGELTSEQGPILAISASACCRKIATASTTNYPSYSSSLCIWECMLVQSAGSFMLEDKLFFDGKIVALNWFRLGNGQLLLGVCLENELRLYALRRHGGQDILKCETPSKRNAWICVAVYSGLPAISNFLWGPKGTAVVVHDEYFSVFSHYLLLSDNAGSNGRVVFPISTASEKSPEKITGGQYQSQASTKMNTEGDLKSHVNTEKCLPAYNSDTRICFLSMSEIADIIGGSLPLFHPEALLINLCSGHWKRAFIALRHLVKHLASSNLSKQGYGAKMCGNIISPVPLSDYLEELLSPSSNDKLFQWSSSQLQIGDYDTPNTSLTSSLSRSEFNDFAEALERLYDYSYITEVEKMQALALIDLLQEVSNPHSNSAYGSLDGPGRRFWVAVRFQQLYFARRFGRLPLAEELVASSGLIGWAFHSDCHENLFQSLLSSEPSWEEMRSMGVGFWYTNVTELRVKMERLARQRYMKNKDPKACMLLYIALNSLQVLAGLFKISKDDKDKPLAGFLSRNFQEDKNKAAALKNAYVLMSKHQPELAIAFFLLGGDASSAVTVCAKNLGDEQLALVICHLVEGRGGSLECNLISKFLLPSALSKGDFWMASFLEWLLGNYSQSFLRMLGVEMRSEFNIAVLSSSSDSFLDPSIGQYCLMLATKTSMKNAIGEINAAVLCQWAALSSVTSFGRCGLPLEALECLSSSVSLSGGTTHGHVMHSPTGNLVEMGKSSIKQSSSNWISDELLCHIMSPYKLHLAMQYISNLLREHPSSVGTASFSFGEFINHDVDSQGLKKLLKEFQDHLTAAIAYFQQKFSLFPCHLISMIVLSLHHNGREFIGQYILVENIPKFLFQEKSSRPDNLLLCPSNLLLKATEEISCLYVKYVVASCKNCFRSTYLTRNDEGRSCWLAAWGFSSEGISWTFWYLRAMLPLFLRSYSEDFLTLLFPLLCLLKCHILFASACLKKNFEALLVLVRPIMVKLMRGDAANEMKIEDLNKNLADIVEILAHNSLTELGTHVQTNGEKQERSGAVPDDKIWYAASASLWMHMSRFLEHQLSKLSEVLDDCGSSPSQHVLDSNDNDLQLQVRLVSNALLESLKLTCADISFYCSKQFATYLLQNVSNRTLLYFEDGLSLAGGEDNYQMSEDTKLLDRGNKLLDFEQLWNTCTDPKLIRGVFLQEYRNWLPYFKEKSSSGWRDAYVSITREFESEETFDKEDRLGSPSHGRGSPLACLSPDDHPFKSSGDKDLYDPKRVVPFQNPIEIYRRNGELLEALCLNSIDHCQAALASNKKGIIYFNWEDGALHRDNSDYIWAEADWPHDGWAGSESIPVPTYVSPGVGLGIKKGAHLGLGGATIGAGALHTPGRDLTGGGAFGIPGYAGAGSSHLGWGLQEGFDEFLDPPATVDNIRTRAFASHPSRPFFLVGSSNTHIYLWEFNKDVATATYGVLPAANVPPPYALASVSAVQFDHFGHRFVTAALDGTVCTWQLEVGGRSNIHPTESSVCFNNHTADVTYVTASGSIVAAAGYSSTGVNVVVWDTLAPPTTSQASIMCHEGGARSLSVFDNDIGSGSISPLILTGGKSGDVGLHDFRYIATGRTKKHKHLDSGEHNISASSSVDMRSKTGDQNRNGMLWYIPKAHSGSVTKISTIPNTSFFLTGSKDGDVKLWDAKMAKLVFHWPRLHERHTFLQPSSRGFGGVVRAAVTDIQVVPHGFLTCGGDVRHGGRSQMESRSRRSSVRSKADLSTSLRRAWYHLRLSVRDPTRVRTWDAIVLTAASPEQAELYDWQLNRAKRMGRIAPSTITLAVPDPYGQRIGSGAATLNAIFALAKHLHQLSLVDLPVAGSSNCNSVSSFSESSNNEIPLLALVELIRKKHILLLHAGGDSKRVPWANPMGKVFLPLPYMAADDPDGPVPLLFDHILAIAACARQAFQNEGGMFIMTGDVLPCFDAFSMVLPEDTASIITVPITLDIASNHGVIVASKFGSRNDNSSVFLVENLLQKPSVEDLVDHKAILDDGRTLLDTGIIAVKGKAWEDLVMLACSSQRMISGLLQSKKEMSLRHLCSIPATTVSDIAASAIIVSSKIAPGVSIGEESLVYDSSISTGVQIGSQSIVVGVNVPEVQSTVAGNSFRFMLPDRHCLWEVPLVGCTERVIVYCGLHDNPKNSISKDGTFCGKPWKKVLGDLRIHDADLWGHKESKDKCLWNAKIFPVLSYSEMLQLATWLMGLSNLEDEYLLHLWKRSGRISLEELHRSIDFSNMWLGSTNHQADLAAGIVAACLNFGLLGRNLSQLCQEILQKEATGVEICKEFLSLCPNLQAQNPQILPKSRAHQVQLDLLRACSDEPMASEMEHKVWAAVANETAMAVRYGFKENVFESSSQSSAIGHAASTSDDTFEQSFHLRKVKVELPVRVDFVGGWSDTPPWSLERSGCVLNMAITLGGSLPVGTIIETTKKTGLLINDDAGNELYINNISSIAPPFDSSDQFRLVKSAVFVTNVINQKIFQSTGLHIKTWANVPRGSGLGTSSILSAAVVKGLLQITDGDDSNENVTRLVLVLEQIMGTGGNTWWQDQVGGLYPGIKFTSSFPGIPLRLQVNPLLASPQLINELQQRLLVVFTGQVRVAQQVLQKVVIRYLQRDNLLISSIRRLVELAKIGREALMNCDIDEVGDIMLEAWRLHQELDPYCSNEFVDKLFAFSDPYCLGYKLVGAGGGGFALMLAKTAESANKLRHLIAENPELDVQVYDWEIFLHK